MWGRARHLTNNSPPLPLGNGHGVTPNPVTYRVTQGGYRLPVDRNLLFRLWLVFIRNEIVFGTLRTHFSRQSRGV